VIEDAQLNPVVVLLPDRVRAQDVHHPQPVARVARVSDAYPHLLAGNAGQARCPDPDPAHAGSYRLNVRHRAGHPQEPAGGTTLGHRKQDITRLVNVKTYRTIEESGDGRVPG
jgi:hypothetical protein